MAETTGRPPAPLPAAPPVSADEAPPAYSSLSLLAVAGLGVAVVYAAVVVGGGLIALSHRIPWILPAWWPAVPAAVVVLCWAARVRIRNSEGALTGGRLALWGLWLSVVVGVLYGAYYGACYLSETSMARKVGDEWFDDLKNDRLDKAFLLGLPPPRPAADAGLRARLELEFDRGGAPGGGGAYTGFRRSQLVRQIEQGGAATRVECLGVKDWGNVVGGYEVQLGYRVSTPYLSTEVLLPVQSVDGGDEGGGRQWYVKSSQTTSPPVLTDEGRGMMDQMRAASAAADQWLDDLREWKWEQAYLGTLPPAERERQAKERGPQFQQGLQGFRDGSLVRAEAPTFWASDANRDAIVAAAKSLFGRGGADPAKAILPPSAPLVRQEAGRIRVGFDIQIPAPPLYTILGRLQMAADVPPDGEPGPNDWRVESLDLVSGKSMSADARPPSERGASAP